MAGSVFLAGPLDLTNTYTTNIYVPGSALIYDIVKQIHVTNRSGSAATFRLFRGATGANAAGTNLAYDQNVAAGSSYDIYFSNLKFSSATFLVGGASASNALVISILGESLVVPV